MDDNKMSKPLDSLSGPDVRACKACNGTGWQPDDPDICSNIECAECGAAVRGEAVAMTTTERDGYEAGIANKSDPNPYRDGSKYRTEWQRGFDAGRAECLSWDAAPVSARAADAPSEPSDAKRNPSSASMPPEIDVALQAAYDLAPWLSAALEDDSVCAEYKAAIRAWFNSAMPRPSFSTSIGKDVKFIALLDWILEAHISGVSFNDRNRFDAGVAELADYIDSRAPAAQAASIPQKWIDVMQELVDLIDDAADGQYEIDTFTAQPGRELLATAPQQEGSEAGNGC